MEILAPLTLLGLLALLGVFALRPIVLVSSDLGRHLMNGKLLSEGFWKNRAVLFRNFYSSSYPDFPFVNHHWLSGVVFHAIDRIGGFGALSVFYFALLAAAFSIQFFLARKQASLAAVIASALLCIPLLGYRADIRPEGLSYLFAAVFFMLLYKKKGLGFLPLLMFVWVNLHIEFVLGFVLVGAFAVERFFVWRRNPAAKKDLIAILATGAACGLAAMVTPFGPRLLFYPLRIFSNYGYRVAENQSLVFFLTHDFHLSVLPAAYTASAVLLAALILLSWRRPGFAIRSALFWIGLAAWLLGSLAIRNLAVMALLGMPVIAAATDELCHLMPARLPALEGLVLAVALLPGAWASGSFADRAGIDMRIGLVPGVEGSAEFFKTNGLHGPIFNNYDIGSYLIYNLFPGEKVFVDNRPEAYPASFFADLYVPMQEDDSVWQKALKQYRFNCIYFFRRDATPWAQRFLIARVQDPQWAPVYVDDTTIIFLRRNAANAELIRKFELPKSMFRVRS